MTWAAIVGLRLVTADPNRLAAFYEAIGFTAEHVAPIAAAEMRVLSLVGAGERRTLRLGDSRLDLDTFQVPGEPYPADASAADLIFQHFAIVTDNARTAWSRAEAAGAVPISRDGPVTLPPASGGVTAVKFRDPDGHPLEFLQFPPGANPNWHGRGILGVDHSAISVSDVAGSRRFYQDAGLSEGDAKLNVGPTQVALDGLDDVRVQVVPLHPPTRPPHLELLGYQQPRGRAHAPLVANDVAATRIVWGAGRQALLRDPDGHLHQLTG